MVFVTADQLFSVVEAACGSSNSRNVSLQQQEAAMTTIHELEGTADGLASSLVNIIESNARIECRILSVILLKNLVIKRWIPRGGKFSQLSNDEKVIVRQYVLRQTAETDKRITSQLAILMAKIARSDWPNNWPELFPSLYEGLKSPTHQQIRFNSILCLHEVIVELSSKSLSFAKSAFATLCVELFPVLAELWRNQQIELANQLQTLQLQELKNDSKVAILFNIDYVITCSKLLTKLLEASVYEIVMSGIIPQYFSYLGESIQVLLAFLRDTRSRLLSIGVKISDFYEGYSASSVMPGLLNSWSADTIEVVMAVRPLVSSLSQQPVILQKMFPLDMVGYIESFLSFYLNELSDECSSSSQLGQRVDGCFAIQAIAFLSNIISCVVYTSGPDSTVSTEMQVSPGNVARLANKLAKSNKIFALNDDDATAAKGVEIRTRFFDANKCVQIVNACLNQLLRYTDLEMQEWLDDAEHFFLTQAGLTTYDTVKSAAENLFLALLEFKPEVVVPHLVSFLMDSRRQTTCVTTPVDDSEIEFWDSVYLCVGLGSSIIGSHINASDWLNNSLGSIVQEVLVHSSRGSLKRGQQLLRCRLLWLLSSWVYHWDASVIGALTQILISIFNKSSNSDLVVRLSSLNTLEAMLRSQNFSPEFLISSIQHLVESLCALINEVEDQETKARVVELFGEVALSVKSELAPILSPLVGYLGNVWNASEAKSPLRRSILEVLTVIIKEAKATSSTLISTAMPLIHFAITGAEHIRIASSSSSEESNEDNAYLLQEGVSLWLALVRNISFHTKEADDLLNASLNTLFKSDGSAGDLDADNLKEVMMVVEAHAISGQATTLHYCADSLKLMFTKVIGGVAARVVPYVMRPLEAFALSCPNDVAYFCGQSGILITMLRACCAYIPGLEENMKEYLEPEIAVVSYLSVIARIQLTDINHFRQAVHQLMSELISRGVSPERTSSDVLLYSIIKQMIEMFDLVASCSAGMWRRKLWCLALLSWYPSTDTTMLNWFPEVLNIVDSVLCEEICEANESPQKHSVDMATALSAYSTEDAAFIGDNDLDVEPVALAMAALVAQDTVNRSELIAVSSYKINAVIQLIGDAAAKDLFESLPQGTLSRLLGQ